MKKQVSRKCVLLFCTVISTFCISSNLFAEDDVQTSENIPYFIEDWEVLGKEQFGSNTEAKMIGDSFKTMSPRILTEVGVISPEEKKGKNHSGTVNRYPLPPWFEKNDINWNATYEDLMTFFSDNRNFTVIEYIKPYVKKDFWVTEEKVYVATLLVFPKDEPKYKITFEFEGFKTIKKFIISWDKSKWNPEKDSSLYTGIDKWEFQTAEDKLLCSLSCNLMAINYQDIYSFNPSVETSKNTSVAVLKNSWGITSYETLNEKLTDLESGGHSGSYNRLAAILDANKDLTIPEIAKKECLSMLDVSRMFFIQKMRTKLGSKGIDAWDKGREITVLRWATAANYISEEEAKKRALVIAEKLRNDYVSWEDYMAHYCAGRFFFGLLDNTFRSKGCVALDKTDECGHYFNMYDIPFEGKNKGEDPVLSLVDVIYTNDEAAKWHKLQAINYKESKDFKASDLTFVEKAESELGETPCISYLKAYISIVLQDYRTAYKTFVSDDILFANCSNTAETYNDWYYYYLLITNSLNKPGEALYAYFRLGDEDKKASVPLFIYGLSNAKLIGSSPDYEENQQFAINAYNGYIAAREAGYALPEQIVEWLQKIENSSEEKE